MCLPILSSDQNLRKTDDQSTVALRGRSQASRRVLLGSCATRVVTGKALVWDWTVPGFPDKNDRGGASPRRASVSRETTWRLQPTATTTAANPGGSLKPSCHPGAAPGFSCLCLYLSHGLSGRRPAVSDPEGSLRGRCGPQAPVVLWSLLSKREVENPLIISSREKASSRDLFFFHDFRERPSTFSEDDKGGCGFLYSANRQTGCSALHQRTSSRNS